MEEEKEKVMKYHAAVLMHGVIIGFVWSDNIYTIGQKALKYFPDCHSIALRESPNRFPDLVRVSENVAFVNREVMWVH